MRCNNQLSLIHFCKQITGYCIASVNYIIYLKFSLIFILFCDRIFCWLIFQLLRNFIQWKPSFTTNIKFFDCLVNKLILFLILHKSRQKINLKTFLLIYNIFNLPHFLSFLCEILVIVLHSWKYRPFLLLRLIVNLRQDKDKFQFFRSHHLRKKFELI